MSSYIGSLCSLIVEILVFINKFALLFSLRCLVGPDGQCELELESPA